MTTTAVRTYELSTTCSCESYDDETDTATPAEYCFGDCWTEAVHFVQDEIIYEWLKKHDRHDLETRVTIEGHRMGWQRRSGSLTTEISDLFDVLAFGHDYTLHFTLDGDRLYVLRYSHDEPSGASFEVTLATEGEDD
jgi:hypothetical protein